MPQPVSNTLTVVSGSLLANKISYVVDGQNRNYRGGFGGLSWMSEAPAENNVIFIGNTSTIGRGPADKPLFYPSFNTSDANIIYAANTLPSSPRNFTTVAGAYDWATNNNFFINSANSPIPRVNGDSLALYIDANQPTSYPQTGTSWFDLSGIGNNSTLYNGPTWNSRGYIDFDGTDDFVGIGNTGVTKLNQNYQTLRFLTYITSVGPNGYAELYAVFNANRTGIKWETAGIGMDANGDFYNVFVNVSNAYSRWMDITCVIDRVSNIFKVYKNGTYIGQDTFTGYTANSTSITVGANNLTGNGGDYIKGSISEISVYGKELSLAEIKQNYFQSNIIQDGLVFMVDANNLVSYPRSGTTSYSLTGSITGTLINGVGFSSMNGGTWVFDGVDDYISAGTSTLSSGDISVFQWIKMSNLTPTGWNIIFTKWFSGATDIHFAVKSGTPRLNLYTTSNSDLYANTTLALDTWYYVGFTLVNGGTLTFYLNGVPDGTHSSVSRTPSNADIYIDDPRPNYGLVGNIASTYVSNRALSPSEVQQNYNETKYRFQGQQIVTNGLVLNLDAANKDSYPGTGTTWTDLSGNGNNGTLLNGVAFNANKNGGVMYFDDTDGTVSIGNSSLFSITNAMTVFAWINPSSTSGWDGIFGGSISGFVHFQLYLGTINIYIYGPNASYSNNDSYNVPANAWISIGFTYDGTTLKVYVNGSQLATTVPGSGNVSSNSDVRVGWAYDTSRVFGGFIGTTQVYNRALSATEILQNYNAQKTRFGL